MYSSTHLHPQHEVSLPPLRLVNNLGTRSERFVQNKCLTAARVRMPDFLAPASG